MWNARSRLVGGTCSYAALLGYRGAPAWTMQESEISQPAPLPDLQEQVGLEL